MQASQGRGRRSFALRLALYQKLADENPAVTSFRFQLAQPIVSRAAACRHGQAGGSRVSHGDDDSAEAVRRKPRRPLVPPFRGSLPLGTRRLLFQMGKRAAAEDECRAAVAIIEKLAEDNPAVTAFRGDLAYALINLGDLERSLGQAAKAKSDYERAITLRESRLATDSTNLDLVSAWRARSGVAGELSSISAIPPARRPRRDGR